MKGIAIWFLKKIYGIDIDGLQNDNKRLKEENGRHISRTNSLEKDKESLSEMATRLEKEMGELEGTNHKLKSNNDESNKENAGLRMSLDDANREINRLKDSLDEANKKIKSLEEKGSTEPIPEVPNGDDENQDEIENLKRQFDNLQKLLEQTNEENRKLRAKTSNQDSTIDNLKKEIKDQKVTVDSQKQTIESLQDDKRNLEKENRNLEKENRNLEEELRKLKGDTLPPQNVSGDGSVIPPEPPEPPVDETKRTIDTVIDIEIDKEVYAKSFFAQPEGVIFKMRTELEKAIYLHRPKYVCKYCGQMVKISGRKTERGLARFFSHLRDSDDCDYKTTTGRTRREINREKFARCNEGERHKFLKAEIAKYLGKTEGVTDVRTENTVKGNHPILRWRRPDVIANYRGQEVVFELQLSTTFVSVIAERDMFYRLNKKHIIWVSNFDEQGEHVDLTNMMVKDIYYNNRLNIFIFDLDAQRESEKNGELMLKCNWLKPDGDWEYPNGNTSDKLGGKFVRLSELTFDSTYKPYFVDAERAYYATHPEFKLKVADIEEENKEILAELDRQWEEELKRGEAEQKKTEERILEIIEDNEIDGDIKSTKKYIIAQRSGLYGLVTYDGLIRMPFIYDEIKSHRGWHEGKRDGAIETFDSNYELIDTDIRRIEKLGDTNKKYVKVNGDDWLWGIMDNNAQPITKSVYSKIDVWSADMFIAVRDGQYCILNKEGNIVIDGYDFISELDSEGFASISKEGRDGRIDAECRAIKTNAEKISDNLSKINKLGKWGIEHNDGTIVVPCEYDDLGSFNNGVIGLSGISFTQLEVCLNTDCPVQVKYVSRNERKMLIFKVGNREAFMNLRQQQKAAKNGLKPAEMTQMYFSHVNKEKNLLYLSTTPVKAIAVKQKMDVNDTDIPVGSIVEGSVVHVDKNSFIIKSEDGKTAYLHRSTWGEHSMNQFNKGQMVKVEKIGFDNEHRKHIWSILSVNWPMDSNE